MRRQLHQKRHRVSLDSVTQPPSRGMIWEILIQLQRQQRHDDERALLQEVGNPGFSPACAAVMQLYREGKLLGNESVLRGKNLTGANWQRAILPEVNLEGTNLKYGDLRDVLFVQANLEKCDFYRANLSGAELTGAKIVGVNFMQADLKRAVLNVAQASRASLFMAHAQRAVMCSITLDHADLQEADLHGARLERANLTNSLLRDTNFPKANLREANLSGAKMINANLLGASLGGARFNENTVLPDAQFMGFDENRRPIFDKYWTPDTDMGRYTNLYHADFWEPEWVSKYEWVQMNYEED